MSDMYTQYTHIITLYKNYPLYIQCGFAKLRWAKLRYGGTDSLMIKLC